MEEMEELCFEIISNVGTARSNYIEAIQCAKEGRFEEADVLIKDAKEYFIKGHDVHAQLLAKEASGEKLDAGVILIHAEDQLMSAEAFSILADEFIDLYHRIG